MAGEWKVLDHGPLEKLEDNLWRLEGSLPGSPPFKRVLTVVRLADGRLVINNGICLDDAALKQIETLGRPAFLVVPGAKHRLDAPAYKSRYPDIVVVSPAGARKDVEKLVKVDTTTPDFGDPNVRWIPLDGVGEGEAVLEVRSGDRVTLVFNDAVMNVPRSGGFFGFVLGVVGFTGDAPKVSGPAKFFLVKNKPALRAHLERLADTPQLARVIVSHGAPFGAPELKAAAATV
jgi:hypothetical protein